MNQKIKYVLEIVRNAPYRYYLSHVNFNNCIDRLLLHTDNKHEVKMIINLYGLQIHSISFDRKHLIDENDNTLISILVKYV